MQHSPAFTIANGFDFILAHGNRNGCMDGTEMIRMRIAAKARRIGALAGHNFAARGEYLNQGAVVILSRNDVSSFQRLKGIILPCKISAKTVATR